MKLNLCIGSTALLAMAYGRLTRFRAARGKDEETQQRCDHIEANLQLRRFRSAIQIPIGRSQDAASNLMRQRSARPASFLCR